LVFYQAENDSDTDHSDRERAGKGHIRGSGVRKADHADSGGKKKEQPARGFSAVAAPGEPGHGQRGEKRSDGAGETRGSFADAEEFEAEGGAPVIEDRLFEPRFAIETGSDPIAGFGHVPGDPGVAGFVRSSKADGAKFVEVTNVKCGEDENDPEETGGERSEVGVDGRVVGLRHGRKSLALAVYLGSVGLS
jgi:hypothetical protein